MNENRLLQLKAMKAADPTDPFLPYAIAQEYMSAGKHAEARAEFEELNAKFPEYLPAYHHWGLACFQLGDIVVAEQAWRSGIALANAQQNRKAAAEMAELLEDLLDQ